MNSNSCFDDFICISSGYNMLKNPGPKDESTNVEVLFKGIQVLISNIDKNESIIAQLTWFY